MIDLKDEWKGTIIPPGNVPFQDPRTGKHFDASAGGMRDRKLDVRNHRLQNPHVYKPEETEQFDLGFIERQIIEYMCNQRPELCHDTEKTAAAQASAQASKAASNLPPPPQTPCHKCVGTSFEPIYCVSCGGNRINGWRCTNCGTEKQA